MQGEVAAPGTRYAPTGPRELESHPATEVLRARYEGYLRRQGRDLLTMIPREGVRALVRESRLAGGLTDQEVRPALAELAAFAATLLPLPPFDVWLEDFNRNRSAHLALTEPPLTDGPTVSGGAPVTVDVRTFAADGCEWVSELHVRSVSQGWRGAVHFHRPGAARVACTGEVFREAHLASLRERFRAADNATLRAFLRSALP